MTGANAEQPDARAYQALEVVAEEEESKTQSTHLDIT